MEGFKKLPKMQCFKTGGSVKAKAMCYGGKMKEGGKADIAQDKAIVKKAFSMHDKQEHPGEKTDLSKLKKGGRFKKETGTVRKYKDGGSVTNVYEAKKKSGDKDNIKNVKQITPTKAKASSAAGKGDNTTAKFDGGGSTTQPGATISQQKFYDQNKAAAKKKEAAADYEAFGSRGDAARKGMQEGRMDPMGTAYKKGGDVKKCAEGGSLKEVDSEDNPGLAKLPTNVRNKMGYMRRGGKAC
jgi:hypothetical protein